MKKLSLTLFLAGISAFGTRVQASNFFSDNFDTDNGGVAFLNIGDYAGTGQDGNANTGLLNPAFPNWTVTSGTVDLIGSTGVSSHNSGGGPDYDFLPGNGLYIDLDGTTGQNGTIKSTGITLAAGNYELSFSLANSQRSQADSTLVSVTVGLASQTFNTPSEPDGAIGFQTEYLDFTVPSGGQTINLVFADTTSPGADNVGALLDNVSVYSVGAPDGGTTVGLLGFGLVCLFVIRARLSKTGDLRR